MPQGDYAAKSFCDRKSEAISRILLFIFKIHHQIHVDTNSGL